MARGVEGAGGRPLGRHPAGARTISVGAEKRRRSFRRARARCAGRDAALRPASELEPQGGSAGDRGRRTAAREKLRLGRALCRKEKELKEMKALAVAAVLLAALPLRAELRSSVLTRRLVGVI